MQNFFFQIQYIQKDKQWKKGVDHLYISFVLLQNIKKTKQKRWEFLNSMSICCNGGVGHWYRLEMDIWIEIESVCVCVCVWATDKKWKDDCQIYGCFIFTNFFHYHQNHQHHHQTLNYFLFNDQWSFLNAYKHYYLVRWKMTKEWI